MTSTPRILAATARPGYPVLKRLFEDVSDVTFVFSMGEGLARLRAGGYDLVVCTIHFDESRMFDFEREARQVAPDVPFVCCRLLDSILKDAVFGAMRVAVDGLGGEFIDRQELHQRLGEEAGDAEFVRRVLARARLPAG
ncbi:MAG TPA: hypothetical protein VD965_08085 [Burkholderiales bacterium]|nr:hypothetical protein [Burkholderiales bacterium]